MELLIFGFFALLALLGAVGVIVSRNPVHSAIYLLVALFSVAALFAVLWAEFLAVVQLLVYAGGIMVLFLFVIMLVDLEQRGLDVEAGRVAGHTSRGVKIAGVGATGVFAVGVGWLMTRALPAFPADGTVLKTAMQGPFQADGMVLGNIAWIGQQLYTSYLLPFELASVLLLVAMIGATVLARREA